MNTEAKRRRVVVAAYDFVHKGAEPNPHEWELLERYIAGTLSLQEVIDFLEEDTLELGLVNTIFRQNVSTAPD